MRRPARRIRSVVARLVVGVLLLLGAALVALEAGVVFRHTFSSDAPDEAVAREQAQPTRRTTTWPPFPPRPAWPPHPPGPVAVVPSDDMRAVSTGALDEAAARAKAQLTRRTMWPPFPPRPALRPCPPEAAGAEGAGEAALESVAPAALEAALKAAGAGVGVEGAVKAAALAAATAALDAAAAAELKAAGTGAGTGEPASPPSPPQLASPPSPPRPASPSRPPNVAAVPSENKTLSTTSDDMTLSTTSTSAPTIPHTLFFTYKHNLPHTRTPLHLYNNVQHTVAEYRAAWGQPRAPVRFLLGRACQSSPATSSTRILALFS